jgi:tetratricopeptide (TPR) repeat protein
MNAATITRANVTRPSLELQVDCLRAEADLLLRDGSDRLGGKPVLEEALQLLEKAGATRGLAYTATLTDLGAMHFRAGRIKEALEYALLTRDAFERNGRSGTLGMVITISNIGQNHYRLGEVIRAEAFSRQAVERMRALGNGETATPGTIILYTIPLIRLGRAEEAEALLTEGKRQAAAGGNQFWIAQASYLLGRAFLELGRYAEAEAEFAAAVEYWQREPAGNLDRLLELDRCHAELALASGRSDEAPSLIGSVLTDMGFPARRDAPGLATALRTAANIELAVGSPGKAEYLASAALEIDTAIARDARQSADVGEAMLLLGLAQRARARTAEARASFERAHLALSNSLGPEHRLTRAARDALQTVLAAA